MKRTLVYLLIFVLIFFIIPVICTRRATEASAISEENEDTSSNIDSDEDISAVTYDYSQYKTIKLYHTDTQEIEELPIDEYIYGTVSAEMPVSYEVEALKAQAIVSRTYTIYQIVNNSSKHGDADVCDDSSCCQAWISKEDRLAKWSEDERDSNWEKIVSAVNDTSGQIITYDGAPINAFFHSNSGGTTEVVSNVWGGTDLPYLQSVETSGESDYSQYSSEVTISKTDLQEKLKKEYSDFKIGFDEDNCIEILEYTDSGRVRTIKFGNIELAGTEARSIFGLKSTNFSFEIDGDNVIFSVTGYGHGVGMSQTGADSMAKSGSSCEEIIKHFYTEVEIIFVNNLIVAQKGTVLFCAKSQKRTVPNCDFS